MQSTVGKGKHR